jgi:diguanylate cyclase (GGDEF)-like protein
MKLSAGDRMPESQNSSVGNNSHPSRMTRKISLRVLAIVPFMVEMAVVGIVGFLSFENSQKAVSELADELQDKVTSSAIVHLDYYLEQAQTLARLNVEAAASEQLSWQDPASLEKYFWQQSQLFQSVDNIYWGTTQGEFIAIARNTERVPLAVTSGKSPKTDFYLLDRNGKRTQLVKTDSLYDPRKRPWYKAATKMQQPVWSEIYLYTNGLKLKNQSKTPADGLSYLKISAAQAFYDQTGKFRGVFGVDLSLQSISEFLSSLEIGTSGQIFIMERSGYLVASSNETPLYTINKNDKRLYRLKASESQDPVIRSVGAYLERDRSNFSRTQDFQQKKINLDGKIVWVDIVPYQDKRGLDWSIVTVVPEADFLSEINSRNYRTGLLCLIALAVATAIGIFLSYQITKPISQLSEACQQVMRGETLNKIDHQRIKEINVLTTSFVRMNKTVREQSQLFAEKVQERTAELEIANEKLKRLASSDSLTQIANRYRFDEYFYQEWRRMAREKQPMSLILFDVDYFKRYNDEYGHQAGDRCLYKIAQTAKACIHRAADVVARYGGEEFAVILPNTPAQGALHIAETIAERVKMLKLPHARSDASRYVTVSLGIATLVPNSELNSSDAIARADRALYQAKEQGRDRAVFFSDKD